MPLPPELYIEKPTRGFKWETIHTMIAIMLMFHIAAFLFLGYLTPGMPRPLMIVYDIGLVKGVGKKGGSRKRSLENKDGQNKINSRKEKKVNVKEEKVLKKKKDPDTVSIKAMLPKESYVRHERQRKNSRVGNQGSITSGTKPGSGGRGEHGTGRSNIGKGKGGAGYGVLIGYPYNLLPQRYDSGTLAKERRRYFNSERSRPLLVQAPMPERNTLYGIGHSKVKVKLLIPEVSDFPNNGISPQSIAIIDIETKRTDRLKAHKQIALNILNNSLWYPARRNGKVIQEYITFYIYIYGTEGR